MRIPPPRLPGELSFLVLIVLFSAFMLWASYNISKFESISSAGAFPMLCAATMLITGLMILRQSARNKVRLEEGETLVQQFMRRLAPVQLILFALLIVAYMLLLEVLGFVVASYLFLVTSMHLLGSRRLVLNLMVSAAVLGFIFVVFQTAFSVVLPAGSLLGPYLPEFLK